MVDKNISMNVNEVLELEYLIEDISSDIVSIESDPTGNLSTKYISKESCIFDPPKAETYQLEINNQIIEIDVYDIPDSGVLRYEFEDDSDTSTAIDSWQNYDGSINGAIYTSDAQNGNSALQFDGTDDSVSIPNYDVAPGSFSISIWAKKDNTGDNDPLLVKLDSNSTGYYLNIQNDSSIDFRILDSNANDVRARPSVSETTDWQHIVATYDSSTDTAELFKNGTSIGSSSSSIGDFSNSVGADIGVDDRGPNYFTGIVDEPRIFSKALSDTEVSNLHSTGSISG